MIKIIEPLQIIVAVVSILFLTILTSLHIIYKIRRLFPIKVNCWFCNKYTTVPYDNSNSWNCSHCEQYNGFTEDGDYNQEIPEQRSSKWNKDKTKNSSFCDKKFIDPFSIKHTNGLCEFCNHNQELKIQQIGSFIPVDEQNYDEEIDEYIKQLERSYALCQKCQKVVKRTLNKVKRNILGSKLAEIGTKQLSILDIQIKKTIITLSKEKMYFSKICYYTLIVFSLINLFEIFQNVDISKSKLETIFPSRFSYIILVLFSYLGAVKYTFISIAQYIYNDVTMSFDFVSFLPDFGNILKVFTIENETNIWMSDIIMQSVGVVLSFGLYMAQIKKTFVQLAILIFWNFGQYLIYIKSNFIKLDDFIIYDVLMITYAVGVFIILSKSKNLIEPEKSKSLDNLNGSFHRIYTEYDNSDISDDESELEHDISSSTTKGRSFISSSPGSFYNQIGSKSVISLDTTKSMGPNEFSQSNSIFNHVIPSVLNDSFNQTYNSLSKSQSFFSAHENPNVSICRAPSEFESASQLNSSFYSTKSNLNENSFNKEFALNKNYHNSNTKQPVGSNGINSINFDSIKLGSINGLISGSRTPVSNPFSSERCNMERPLSAMSACSRNSVFLAPSRLNYNVSSAASQSSWVAGGYWGSTSPKKILIPSTTYVPNPSTMNFCPIISRTSSQSSGFESQPRNSRESSVGGDDIDHSSIFSEPVSNYLNNTNSNNPMLSKTILNYHNYNKKLGSSVTNMCNNYSQNLIPRGRLLKNWIDKNNANISDCDKNTNSNINF